MDGQPHIMLALDVDIVSWLSVIRFRVVVTYRCHLRLDAHVYSQSLADMRY